MDEKKCCSKVFSVLAIIGAIVAIAGIAYAVVRFCLPDYLEDFDDFDDFDDDDEEDEEDEEEAITVDPVVE